jgi:hypothetical protein
VHTRSSEVCVCARYRRRTRPESPRTTSASRSWRCRRTIRHGVRSSSLLSSENFNFLTNAAELTMNYFTIVSSISEELLKPVDLILTRIRVIPSRLHAIREALAQLSICSVKVPPLQHHVSARIGELLGEMIPFGPQIIVYLMDVRIIVLRPFLRKCRRRRRIPTSRVLKIHILATKICNSLLESCAFSLSLPPART